MSKRQTIQLPKDRQHNSQKKKDKRKHNVTHNTTQKTKDPAARTPLSPGMNSGVAEGLAVLVTLLYYCTVTGVFMLTLVISLYYN
jgi:hypothetical protein